MKYMNIDQKYFSSDGVTVFVNLGQIFMLTKFVVEVHSIVLEVPSHGDGDHWCILRFCVSEDGVRMPKHWINRWVCSVKLEVQENTYPTRISDARVLISSYPRARIAHLWFRFVWLRCEYMYPIFWVVWQILRGSTFLGITCAAFWAMKLFSSASGGCICVDGYPNHQHLARYISEQKFWT